MRSDQSFFLTLNTLIIQGLQRKGDHFWKKSMAPSVPISLRLPGLKQLLKDADTVSLYPACFGLPAAETKAFPRAWDSDIPQGEEADGARELDANSSSALVGKPEVTEKKSKTFCYHFSTAGAVWQMSRPRFDFHLCQRHALWPWASHSASLCLHFLTFKRRD